MKNLSNAQVVLDDLARSAGVELNSDSRETFVALFQGAAVAFEPGKAVMAKDEAGNEIAAAEWFRGALVKYPGFAKAKADPAAPRPAGTMNMTQRGIAANAARKSDRSEEATALVQSHGNPWKTGNRTHQAFVTNTNETLANRLKLEAGR